MIGHGGIHARNTTKEVASLDVKRVLPLRKLVLEHRLDILRRTADGFVTTEILALTGSAAVDLVFAARTEE